MIRLAVVFALLLANSVSAQEIHCKHFLHGHPTGTPETNDLIIRDCYALSSNDATKFADWVAYRLTPAEVFGELDLEREWRNDPWLEENERLEADPKSQDDYAGAFRGAGYDRGHLAPLGSFQGSRNASQVNFYSNIVPQKSAMNQGPWGRLEEAERQLAMRYHRLWVITGPLYEKDAPPLPGADEPHKVPSAFWKLVIVQPNGPASLRSAAFIFDQDTPRGADIADHVTTIREVENRSGLEFLRGLPDDLQEEIETAKNRVWVQDEFRGD